jgi:hypothetical protein
MVRLGRKHASRSSRCGSGTLTTSSRRCSTTTTGCQRIFVRSYLSNEFGDSSSTSRCQLAGKPTRRRGGSATASELLFDRYCKARGFESVPIAAGPKQGKTPDRHVLTPAGRFVVEIKELTPNDEDVERAHALLAGKNFSGTTNPGDRAARHIKEAAPQLKRQATADAPGVLVLYDNIVVDGFRPWGHSKHLCSSFIDFAMYGYQTVNLQLLPSADGVRVIDAGDGRGGRRRLTTDERTYISAVAVLHEEPESGDPFLVTYHNYFARWALATTAFRGGRDRHFRKAIHPDGSPQEWEEVP